MPKIATNLFGDPQPLTPPDTYAHVRFCIYGNGVDYTGTALLYREDLNYIQSLWRDGGDDWVDAVEWKWDEGCKPPSEWREGMLRLGTPDEINEIGSE